MQSNIVKGFGATTMTIFGLIEMKFYGLDVIILMFFLMNVLSLLDILLGSYLARRHKITTSRSFLDGVVAKTIKGGVVLFIIVMLGFVGNHTDNEAVLMLLSLSAIALTALFIWGELVSIVENSSLISHDNNKTVLGWLRRILGIGQRVIERKIEKYEIDDNIAEKILKKPET